MSTLHFSDGVSINTTGKLRVLHLADGYYVVGEGMLMPVRDEKEAVEFIKEHKERNANG